MSKVTLRAGQQSVIASVPQEDRPGENAVAVCVSGGIVPWCLHFRAKIGQRKVHVGSVRIFPSAIERLVAVVAVPGAIAYEVTGEVSVPGTTDQLAVTLEGIEAKAGPWGVQAIEGNSVPGGRSYRALSGANGGPIVVDGTVHGWTAYSIAGGTVTVTASPGLSWTVPVPAGSTASGDCRGLLAPSSSWTFAGTDSYFIEYEPPNGVFDG